MNALFCLQTYAISFKPSNVYTGKILRARDYIDLTYLVQHKIMSKTNLDIPITVAHTLMKFSELTHKISGYIFLH